MRFCLDILAAAHLAREFRGNIDFAAFETDRKTQSAVLHQLLIIGEAVKRLSEPFCRQHSQIPWSLLARMRDRLIHGYDSVDLTIVWKTVTDDMPLLIPLLAAIAKRTDSNDTLG